MNSYLYDDDAFAANPVSTYSTEQEYWEEYDAIKAGRLSECSAN